MRRGFLLAAGFGTRLRPLTNHRPKPLTPVCGIPMLDHAAALLQRAGIESAVVNAHWLPEQIEAWADAHPMDLFVSVEQPDILGTGGGLRKALAELADPFVVVNGDILSDVDVLGLLEAAGGEALAAMALRRLDPDQTYGQVKADSTGTVCDLVRLAYTGPVGELVPGTHFTGVHALRHELVRRLPAEGESCIVRQAYVSAVPERRVRALTHDGTWFDVGTPQAYLEANMQAVRGDLVLPIDPHERAAFAQRPGARRGDPPADVTIEGSVWIGEGAEIAAGAHLGPDVVIGAGARIGSGARLQRTVVWDGCEVPQDAELEAAIVHDGGVLETARRSASSE
ncbi:MAG: NDP-sugar synthase [Proteobacteria bacterium]|nr:NDP-sugar synthase [Pseudomonadota bacterium]MCP4915978.1 NDP-sugar synthase [Pseudomonadota bacterium]